MVGSSHTQMMVYSSALSLAQSTTEVNDQQATYWLAHEVMGQRSLGIDDAGAVGLGAWALLSSAGNETAGNAIGDYKARRENAYKESDREPVHLDSSPALSRFSNDNYSAFRGTLETVVTAHFP